MPEETVVDTSVLQKANATINQPPDPRSLFTKRVELLVALHEGRRAALISKQLLAEYERKLPSPRNDYVRLFFELLADPARRVYNYVTWPSREREKARRCRYPVHDDPVLRTAIRPQRSTIVTEDGAMLRAETCVYREFRVRIIHTSDT